MDPIDQHDVTDLLHRYCECIDRRQLDRLASVFTPDADVDLGYGTWRTLDAIVPGYEQLLAPTSGTAHSLTNIRTSLDVASGTATSYVHAWHWIPQADTDPVDVPADFLFIALYRDDLVKLDGVGWRISRRRARRIGPTALAVGAMPDSMAPQQGTR